jgi:hypothetical protein
MKLKNAADAMPVVTVALDEVEESVVTPTVE